MSDRIFQSLAILGMIINNTERKTAMDTMDYVLYTFSILGMIVFAPFVLPVIAIIFFINLYYKKNKAVA